jgi:hypothetical protein
MFAVDSARFEVRVVSPLTIGASEPDLAVIAHDAARPNHQGTRRDGRNCRARYERGLTPAPDADSLASCREPRRHASVCVLAGPPLAISSQQSFAPSPGFRSVAARGLSARLPLQMPAGSERKSRSSRAGAISCPELREERARGVRDLARGTPQAKPAAASISASGSTVPCGSSSSG